ncbi:MAG: ATP-dependent DNA helicase RecG [Bacteroidota bacterium]|nr:ATP-dependent DNA helicase RecG [Bacteroidota bacterium]
MVLPFNSFAIFSNLHSIYICNKKFISPTASILLNPIEYLKGVGPQRGDLLKKELKIFTFKDLLEFYPYRHIDKTQVTKIINITDATDYVQVKGKLTQVDNLGEKRGRRLVANLQDDTGELELVWFQGINWIQKTLSIGSQYLVFGRAGFFMNHPQITHPEMELVTTEKADGKNFLEPIYPSTEKLKARSLSGRQIGKLTYNLFQILNEKEMPENLPAFIIKQYNFISRYKAIKQIHFPANADEYRDAVKRLKFEELFLSQLRLGMLRSERHRFSKGLVFNKVGEMFNTFYNNYLPFQLTGAQKRVLKEIRKDAGSGKQMNRLLQGDVGSGKTMVALLSMLIAADNGFQSCLMAPTEILAQQHYSGITELLKDMPVYVRILTGSSSLKERKEILQKCEEGEMHILIGTHAIIEDSVQFKNLGLAIVDEQHRFGVEQRSKLWKKNETHPHILVMTATPIPRTLALTAYGDLDYSIMDEMPPGRHPITTVHRYEYKRPQVMDFIKEEIKKGRQAYIIYPLIEESAKMDFENLMKGYEEVKAFFPEPQYWISMVHGRQKAAQKNDNMQRFVKGDTQIMVSTTVIEVGVNVPNASVMVIESAEKFGLPQLHQLRGRVGRGSEKSFCILLTGTKISNEAKQRLKIMCDTNDGFKIAEKDLEIRGPGDIEGTKQSGVLDFKLANIINDKQLLEEARNIAEILVEDDPHLNKMENSSLKNFIQMQKGKTIWSKIS